MKLVSKNDLNNLFGKKGFICNQLIGKLTYISGIPEMDEALQGKSFLESPCLVNFLKRKEGLEISMMHKFKSYYTGIKDKNLISISLEDKQQIYENKEKSVIGRALVGGLVLGPVGAVIGGMTGIKDKKVAVEMPDLFVTVCFLNEEGKENHLILSCENKNKNEIEKFCKQSYPRIFNKELVC